VGIKIRKKRMVERGRGYGKKPRVKLISFQKVSKNLRKKRGVTIGDCTGGKNSGG